MRFLLAVPIVAGAFCAQAQDLGQNQPVTALFYWQKPLDAIEKKDSASAFGFRLDRASTTSSAVFRKPLLDLRFNERGFQSFAFRGTVLHQNQPASGGAPEINWWIVGGVVVGAVVLINYDNKRSSSNDCRITTPGGGVIPCP